MSKPDLTIIVVSTDSYADIWAPFFDCKNKYWNDCKYETILVNNTLNVTYSNTYVLNCGEDAQWSDRTRKVLSEIDTKYVCFLLEDYFISSTVDNDTIDEVISFMETSGIKYYKLLSLSEFKSAPYKKSNHLREITAKYPYGISLMPAIWDRQYFIDMVGKDSYTPWKFEVDRLIEEKKATTDEIIGVYDNRNILNITHMIVQGKYLRNSYKIIKEKGIDISLDSREVMTLWEYYRHRLKQKLGGYIKKIPYIMEIGKPLKKYSVSAKYID